MFVGLVVIAMTAEMIANGIHCEHVVHDGQSDEGKGGELHDRNGLIQISCIWGNARCLWMGGLWEQNERPNSTLHERERQRERLCFDVLVAALSTQDPKPSTEEQKAREQERKMTAQRSPKEAREMISGCEKHAKSTIGSNENKARPVALVAMI